MSRFANQADMQHSPIKELADRRLTVDGGVLALFSSHSLDTPLPGETQAVVVVHGALRNAGDYYRAIQAAAHLASSHPIIVAPQFLTEVDVQDDPARSTLLHWGTEEWKGGLGRPSSFMVFDRLLEALSTFPDLQRVTIVGNSAGGQFVNRYAAVGRGIEAQGIAMRLVIVNPSTYLYFDRDRPTWGGFARHEDSRVDQWRYGFGGGVPDYVQQTPQGCFKRYISREVIYLLGDEDTDPDAVLLEVHPAAAAQGRDRRERGELYHAYLKRKTGRSVHRMLRVRGVGHDASAMFASPEGRQSLFDGSKLVPA